MRRFLFLFLLLAFTVHCDCGVSSPESYWNQETIVQPTDFLFGYGSLVNSESRRVSVKRDIQVIPVRISHEFGYRRAWNTLIRGWTTLGLEKVSQDQALSINGVLYAVTDEEMELWDERESAYDRVEIPQEYIEAAAWQKLCTRCGKVWVYVPKETADSSTFARASYEYPLLQSYLDIVLLGFLEYGEGFVNEFLTTTVGWSDFWLDDRLLSRRPWVYLPESSMLDKLVQKHPSEELREHYSHRSFVSAYENTR